jgi:hypothetical protein
MMSNLDKPFVAEVGNWGNWRCDMGVPRAVLACLISTTEGEAGCGTNSAVMAQLLILVAGDGALDFVSDSHCEGRQYHKGTVIFESKNTESMRRCEGAAADDRNE